MVDMKHIDKKSKRNYKNNKIIIYIIMCKSRIDRVLPRQCVDSTMLDKLPIQYSQGNVIVITSSLQSKRKGMINVNIS